MGIGGNIGLRCNANLSNAQVYSDVTYKTRDALRFPWLPWGVYPHGLHQDGKRRRYGIEDWTCSSVFSDAMKNTKATLKKYHRKTTDFSSVYGRKLPRAQTLPR